MKNRNAYPLYADLTSQDMDLYVVSVGVQTYFSGDVPSSTCRPNGRADYHFYCVLHGGSRCVINGKTYELHSGQAVFYDYSDAQEYQHTESSETTVYWIHFNGTQAKSLLRELGFTESRCFTVGKAVSDFFETILHELTLKRPFYLKASAAALQAMLVYMARSFSLIPKNDLFDHVLTLMNNTEYNNVRLEEFADLCCLSKSQFIKRFTKYTGVTPIRYRNEKIIQHACWYLRNTELPIKEIAALLKFENVYYFSNAFKKQTGISPQAFRNGD